jgi:hypothetical protein
VNNYEKGREIRKGNQKKPPHELVRYTNVSIRDGIKL